MILNIKYKASIVSEHNRHGEIDSGAPVGKEVW